MFNLESIDLTLNLNPFMILLAVLTITAFAVFVYRYTIPQISVTKKVLLVFIRSAALILLLLLLFEPMISFARKISFEPVHLIFIDNSSSIKTEDGTDRVGNIRGFIKDTRNSSISKSASFYTFGNTVTDVPSDSMDNISFNEGITDFSRIFESIKKSEQNIASVTIISDGVITSGSNPLFSVEKSGIPVYTVGVGDTSSRNDIAVRNVLFNEIVYAGVSTPVIVSVSNKGFAGSSANVALYEDDKLIEQQNIVLSEDGIQNISFSYEPVSGGEKKLSVVVSPLSGEFTEKNNRSIFYLNVLSGKVNVLVISASPSADLSFIKNSLRKDENLNVTSITYVSANRIIEKTNPSAKTDSAQILFLAGFPAAETPDAVINMVADAIREKSKPFFIVLSPGTDLKKLSVLQSELPFSINTVIQGYSLVQPEISSAQTNNPLLQNNAGDLQAAWNNLPPVLQTNSQLSAKPESDILSRIRINNVPVNKPLIVTRKLGSKRAVAVLAQDIWRWKLQASSRDINLFDSFILNSLRWLNASEEQKQVSVKTLKRSYSAGELVEFTAQVYDDVFNPLSNAELKINIRKEGETSSINLSSLGNGLYEGTFQTNVPGDYTFSATASQNGKEIGSDNGRFSIGEIDVEFLNPSADAGFLSALANISGGKFYYAGEHQSLFNELEEISAKSRSDKIITGEINLWSSEWLLVFLILLLASEWFFRKKEGMM